MHGRHEKSGSKRSGRAEKEDMVMGKIMEETQGGARG